MEVKSRLGDKMLDKIIDKFLNILLDSKTLRELADNTIFKKVIEVLEDRKYMHHIIKYLFFGVLTTIVSLTSFWAFMQIKILDENICNLFSIILAIIFAYIVNRKFVFESVEKNIIKEFTKFVGARIISMIFELVAFYVLVTRLSFDEMFIKIVLTIIVIVLNYIFSKLLVFKK